MPEGSGRDRDLVLVPGEFAFILDTTKGNVNVIVGPNKTSMSATDHPVTWDDRRRRFSKVEMDQAVQAFPNAPEGSYIVLASPAVTKEEEHPRDGVSTNTVKLQVGRKIIIPGPTNFPLWPGQTAQVVEGHRLRSNQYLFVRVYNEEQARENWTKGVVKRQAAPPTPPAKGEAGGAQTPSPATTVTEEAPPKLFTGQLLVVKGTEVAFYIPPTGVEVLQDTNNAHVRDAVTLERLEYCILLDENGNKRFVQGPAVVFPEPTETFVEQNSARKFRAIELNDNSGLYIKVIADYDEGTGEKNVQRKVGEELFITGRDLAIYFPRSEHAIIRYGEQEKHHAIAIPAGEARYVLDRLTGAVNIVSGPKMFLPDPRKEVVVRRVLDQKTVALWFPGNDRALQVNNELAALCGEDREYVEVATLGGSSGTRSMREQHVDRFAGEQIARKTSYSPPRTITLDTKYDGVVSVDVWTGYAVLVVKKTGERRVVVGPQTVLLEYDETLMPMELSTGTPKSDDHPIKTVFLRVLHNKVSDRVTAETQDLCPVEVGLSYRVNFEGDPNKWSDVENYVKFLTDHLRSLIRNAVKQQGIEHFYANAIAAIRDAVLGASQGDAKQRTGRAFPENGMRVYDVEVLDVKITNPQIAGLLTGAQTDAIQQAVNIAKDERRRDFTLRSEAIKQEIATAVAETVEQQLALETTKVAKQLELNLEQIRAQVEADTKKLDAEKEKQATLDTLSAADLARKKAAEDQRLAIAKTELDEEIRQRMAAAEEFAKKMGAVTPEFTAALQAFGDKMLAAKATEAMAPLAILGGKSVADVLNQLLKGTVLERVLQAVPAGANGDGDTAVAARR